MPPGPKFTALDHALYGHLVAHRTPDDDVVRELVDHRVESVMLALADGLTLCPQARVRAETRPSLRTEASTIRRWDEAGL